MSRRRDGFLAIDFGTTVTVAATQRTGEAPQLVTFSEPSGEADHLASAVYSPGFGRLLVGEAAAHAIQRDPLGGQPTPKSLIVNGREVETLSGRPFPLVALVAAILREAYGAAVAGLGGEPERVVLTCPVAWAPDGAEAIKRPVLRAAAQLAGIPGDPMLMNEAEAAAHHLGGGLPPISEGELCGIYDLGGGTCDIAVLRRDQGRLTVVSIGEVEVGGEQFDWLLLEHLLERIESENAAAADALRATAGGSRRIVAQQEPGPSPCAVLGAAVRAAKEQLDDAASTVVRVPEPVGLELTVTQADLEALVREPVMATVEEAEACVERAAASPGHRGLSSFFLVGGASQMPLVRRALASVIEGEVRLAEQPRAAAALGAVQALEARAARRRGARGRAPAVGHHEVHALGVLGCAAIGEVAYLTHLDPAGIPTLTRLDLLRGAADRSVELRGHPLGDGALLSSGATADVVAVAGPDWVTVRDSELSAVAELPSDERPRAAVVFVRCSGRTVWIGYTADGPHEMRHARGASRRLGVMTVSLPDPTRSDGRLLIRDLEVGTMAAQAVARGGGPPTLVAEDCTDAGEHQLTVAVPGSGLLGPEQHVFLVEADGRARKLQTRRASPWLLSREVTATGELILEGVVGDARWPQVPYLDHATLRSGATELMALAGEAGVDVSVGLLSLSGGACVAIASSEPTWELMRVESSARAESEGGEGGIHHLESRPPPWRMTERRGLRRLRYATDTRLHLDRRPVFEASAVWLTTSGEHGTAAVRVGSQGQDVTVELPDGAEPVAAVPGRLYYLVQGDGNGRELRSVGFSD